MKQEYIDQMARLKKQPELISIEWSNATGMFRYLGDMFVTRCGCPLQVKAKTAFGGQPAAAYPKGALDEKFTKYVQDHPGIPLKHTDITPAHLSAFIEIQEEFDKLNT